MKCYTIKKIVFSFVVCGMCFASIQKEILQMPEELVTMKLSNISQKTKNEIIVKFDINDIRSMQVQFQSAMNALKKEQNDIALRILWDLAERGYPEAYRELWVGFSSEKLVKKNYKDWIKFFHTMYDCVPNLETIIYYQNKMRKKIEDGLNKNEYTHKLSTDSQPPVSSTLSETGGGIRSRTLKVH